MKNVSFLKALVPPIGAIGVNKVGIWLSIFVSLLANAGAPSLTNKPIPHELPSDCSELLGFEIPTGAATSGVRPQANSGYFKHLVSRLRRHIDVIRQKQSSFGKWSARNNSCSSMSPQLALELRKLGFPVRIVEVTSEAPLVTKSGNLVEGKSYHMFLILELMNRHLIIDPTFKQFLVDEKQPDGDDIFIGFKEDLLNFFRVNHAAIVTEQYRTWSHYNLSQVGSYDPVTFVNKIYGFSNTKSNVRILTKEFSYASLKWIEFEPEAVPISFFDEKRETYTLDLGTVKP